MSRLKTDAIRNVNASVDGITLDTSGNVVIPEGKVSIGTGTARQLLHLNVDDSGAANIVFTNTTTGTAASDGFVIGITGSEDGQIWHQESANIKFGTGDSERFRIDGSGRVLIGTTTAGFAAYGDVLTIEKSSHVGLTLRTATNKDAAIYFADSSSGGGRYAGFIDYSHGSNYLRFGTNEVEKLRITSAGKVGIGTTSPVGLLELDGGSGAFSIQFKETSQSWHRMGFQKNGSLLQIGEFNNDGSNFQPILNVDGNGDKVGIGTTSPGHKLSILGGSSSQLEIKGTEADLWLNSTGPSGGGIWRILGSTGGSTHRFRIYDNTNSREPFYIDGGTGHSTFTRASTGTVAHFITNARECNILLQNDARTWKIVNYDYTNAGADNLGFHDGTADRFIIKNNGNVQIPDGDLEVASGHGIDFSATSGTGTSELFDDYEEGTWTPTIQFSNGGDTATYTSNRGGWYVKVGRLVTLNGRIEISAKGSGSSAVYFGGLPFTVGNHNSGNSGIEGGLTISYMGNVNADKGSGIIGGYASENTTYAVPFYVDTSNNFHYVEDFDLESDASIGFTISYCV